MYRYELVREWDETKPKALFIMLNPSTADADKDDPTIRRCIGFAKNWDLGGIVVINLFAYRSSHPRDLLTASDPIGKYNLIHFQKYNYNVVVCAWGNGKLVEKLGKIYGGKYKPLTGFNDLCYLELCNDGTPRHPLHLKGDLKPKKFKVVRSCRL